ncbi:MAG: hypothetical protein WD825_15990 [Gemmatimonadaceae bacterium]
MRHSLAYAALFTVWLAAACSDAPTVSPQLMRTGGPVTHSLSEDIDLMVADFFPKGLETATGARWSTVKSKLADGDVAGAAKHLVDLAKFIRLKTGDVVAPAGETQQHAAARLVLAMSTYVFSGPTAPTPQPGPDIEVAVVPAGEPATVQTPSEHAAVDLEAGSTNEDRIIVISQEQTLFLEQCSGPLPTTLCQYPLFYRFESFPKLALNKVGRFAACMVTSGPRRPLEYTEGESTKEVDDRMRLAHNKPESEADYTPGSTIIEGIEVLPKAETQKGGLITCEGVVYPPVVVAARGGWLGIGERALYAVANFAGWLLTPKNLYAWDSGPEHDSRFFSNFNGVDPGSRPDLSAATTTAPANAFGGDAISVTFSVENRSRRSGGYATAASTQTTAQVYLINSDGAQVATLGNPFTILAMRPDDAAQQFAMLVTLPDVPLNRQYAVRAVVTPGPGLPEVEDEGASGNNSKDAPIRIDSRSRDNIAIYKNYNAWFGSNKDEAVLQAAPFNLTSGEGYVVRPMSQLAAGIPAETELIIITSASSGNNLDQITEQRAGAANLEAWIRNGGWLVIHAGDNEPYSNDETYLIPGLTGQKDRILGCTGLTLNVANHALVRGPDAALGTADDLTNTNIDNGGRFCSDNHGSLAGVLPAGAEVLINEEGGSQRPVYATYELGAGRVIVTTLTLEFPAHTTQTLINHFYWAINGTTAGPALRALMANIVGDDAPVTVNTDGTPRNP